MRDWFPSPRGDKPREPPQGTPAPRRRTTSGIHDKRAGQPGNSPQGSAELALSSNPLVLAAGSLWL